MIAALAAALVLSAGPPARPQAPAPAGKEPSAQPAPAPLPDEDAAIVEHLELLQKLELLQDLDVVDTGRDDREAKDEQPAER